MKSEGKNITNELTSLLRKINQGSDPKMLRSRAHQMLDKVDPRSIAEAEQNLIEAGYSASHVQQLSAAFMLIGVLEEDKEDIKSSLPYNHILKKVMAEHDMAMCFLADFDETVDKIMKMNHLTDVSCEFRNLTHIVEHMSGMEEHIAREEDVIFPAMKRGGWTNLCRSAECDHAYIRIAIEDLTDMMLTFNPEKLREFKMRLNSIADFLGSTVKDHLFQEENILFPIALEVIKDQKVWEKMKTVCSEIGYCGIHT